MKSQLIKLARHSAIYGIGSALAAAGGVLLIPLYTHVLTTAEYGILELLNRIADVLILTMFMGVRQAYIRCYFDNRTEAWQKTVTATTVAFVLLSSITIAFLFYPFRTILLDNFFKGSVGDPLFLLVLIWLPLEMLVYIGLAYLQVRMKSVLYITINFVRLLGFIALNLVLLYVYNKGVLGVFLAQIVVTGTIASGFLLYFIKWTRVKISIPVIRELLTFGLPYLPAAVFMYIISNADRYFLTIYASLDTVGIYGLAYKFGMLGVMLLLEPFNKVWAPFLFENYSAPEGPTLISKAFTLFTLVAAFVGLSISVLTPVVLPLISDESFHSASRVVPLICLASVFYGMACLADAGILIAKKTHYKPLIFGSASAIGVLANIILIPRFGILGAAIAIAMAFLSLLVINFSFSNRFYRLPLDLRKILIVFLAVSASYLLSMFAVSSESHLAYATFMALICIASFPMLLWFVGFFSQEEKLVIRSLLGRLVRQRNS